MPDKALVVFTRKNKQSLIKRGGTAAWALRPEIVRGFTHVICARNTGRDEDDSSVPGPEPRGTAFLVGQICGVEFLYHRNNRDRYLVRFDSVAEVLVPGFWDGSRNPVRYMPVAEIKRRGIDLETLELEPLEEARRRTGEPAPAAADLPPPRLTIAEAKAGLAATFDVPADSIEIIIRG